MAAVYHDFAADSGSQDYGTEVDLSLNRKLGSRYGLLFKFAGFDAVEVQGIADKEIIVFVDGNEGLVQIIEAPEEETNSHLVAEEMVALFADKPQETMEKARDLRPDLITPTP